MNVLLDSCALIALSNGALPPDSSAALAAAPRAYASVVSIWELAIKHAGGKLTLSHPPHFWFMEMCEEHRLIEVALTSAEVCSAAALPLLHKDPFDRSIIATALARELTILTSDRTIPTYPGVRTLW